MRCDTYKENPKKQTNKIIADLKLVDALPKSYTKLTSPHFILDPGKKESEI